MFSTCQIDFTCKLCYYVKTMQICVVRVLGISPPFSYKALGKTASILIKTRPSFIGWASFVFLRYLLDCLGSHHNFVIWVEPDIRDDLCNLFRRVVLK
jgi:hypothetical protein